MQHIINVAFDFDDEIVKRRIEEHAEEYVLGGIKEEIHKYLFGDRLGYRFDRTHDIAVGLVKSVIDDNKEAIIDVAGRYLAEKLARTKAAREKLGEVLDE